MKQMSFSEGNIIKILTTEETHRKMTHHSLGRGNAVLQIIHKRGVMEICILRASRYLSGGKMS
jgi:phage portal protein BeeE